MRQRAADNMKGDCIMDDKTFILLVLIIIAYLLG